MLESIVLMGETVYALVLESIVLMGETVYALVHESIVWMGKLSMLLCLRVLF